MNNLNETENEEFDVAVVGGGPGGATAAYQLGKNGFDVALVDKEKFPRHKTCGGMLTEKVYQLNQKVFDVSFQELETENIINSTSNGYETWNKNRCILKGSTDFNYGMVDRKVYDDFLFSKTRALEGVKVFEETKITGIDHEKMTLTGPGDGKIKAKYIIGADGASSTIRKSLMENNKIKISKKRWKKNLAAAIEAYVPKTSVDRKIRTPLLHLGVVEWGYGWVFPHADRYVVGVGGLPDKNDNFRKLLMDYLDLLDMGGKDYEIKGAPVPYGNYISDPGYQNILLIGDAAGLTDPLTAEGIFYAQFSGWLAARTINNCKENQYVSSEYAEKLNENVIPELKWAKFLRKLFFSGPEFIRRPVIKFLLPKIADNLLEIFHGQKSYNFFRSRKLEFFKNQ